MKKTNQKITECCPVCGSEKFSRERRPNGDDVCENGHKYASKDSKKKVSITNN